MIISIKQISLNSDAISVIKKIVDLGTTPIKNEITSKTMPKINLKIELEIDHLMISTSKKGSDNTF